MDSGNETGRVAILIIDDEASMRELLCGYLANFDVMAFSGGEEAVEWLGAHPEKAFQLAVCDYSMPGMNGVKTLRAIGRLAPGAKLVLMSGVVAGDLERFAEENGFHGVLAKPFQMKKLDDLVASLLA
ncbi:MAG: response regulator [Verrucomicrobiae bacterium]|nr:response regulator [Verrucomicrobiae bacterium]